MYCGRFPAIRMDEARDFEDEESLGHPRNQVYAIIDDAENARRAAKELNSIGIEPANIGLLIGKEDATKLDAATGEHGFLAKAARIGLELGDRDTDYLAYSSSFSPHFCPGEAISGYSHRSVCILLESLPPPIYRCRGLAVAPRSPSMPNATESTFTSKLPTWPPRPTIMVL
jgi:hypothetical protein